MDKQRNGRPNAMRYTPINCSRCGRFVGADGDPDVGYNPDTGLYDIGYPECGRCIRLYEDTVTPGVGCHRCAGAAGAHDEGCAMAEVGVLLGGGLNAAS